jgi:HAD superfamily hydrolase (TIGR01484 family)
MIKLIVLDVDGVVKGFAEGLNSPYPSQPVAEYLINLNQKGLPICLCTGKVSFATKKIIERLQLNNLHIADGGAVIFNPLENSVLKNSQLPSQPLSTILGETTKQSFYWELYTLSCKYVKAGHYPTSLHEDRNLMLCEEIPDLLTIATKDVLTKAEIKYLPEHEGYLHELFSSYNDIFNLQWTYVPSLLPLKILVITAKGISKRSAVNEVENYYQVTPAEVLAVGDTMMDWGFMEKSGFVATMGNANDKMKKIITDHKGFIGGHVDDDGLIDILEHFKEHLYE